MAPHLRAGDFHVPLEVVLPALEACGVAITDHDLLRAKCPAEDQHTKPNGPGDCIIFPNQGVPRIYCHHRSCKAVILATNRRLFAHCQGSSRVVTASMHSPVQSQVWRERQHQNHELKRHAIALFSGIQKECRWPSEAIKADSPEVIAFPVHHHHRYILDLFQDNDVVWCADEVNRTGQCWHAKHFRSVSRWMSRGLFPGAFTCPNTFFPGTFSRAEANVAARKYLVVESDSLDRDRIGAVFRWLDGHLGLPLRAVIDTGNKSLHGWFEYPPDGLLERLKVILPVLGCDPKMFGASQPCRLPGVIRPQTGRWQELLYLAPPR